LLLPLQSPILRLADMIVDMPSVLNRSLGIDALVAFAQRRTGLLASEQDHGNRWSCGHAF
jgi:hypothetical protein